jgi:DNA topoisomerase-2
VAIAPSDDGFQQFSFVNSIATTKGGKHVDHVAEQVVDRLLEFIKKKHKGMDKVLKPMHVKNHLKLFINCQIENPAFDSQTKEFMTLKQSAFGSKCAPSDKFFKDVQSCGVIDSILAFAQSKQNKELKKTDGAKKARLTGISKLDDANEAGGRNGHMCTLIITEGDSAKALAVSGLAVIGRDYYGVFPLRGKLLNVRDAPHSTIMNNKEISELKQIIGLQQGKDYSDPASRKTLRYGHLMIMTDQDHDGSHIKGLIINFLHVYWPSLLHSGDFLREFVTPIVKVSRNRQSTPFFTLMEYEAWRRSLGGAASAYTIKYYKGLGTSTSQEAKEYFSDLPRHELTFEWEGEVASELIERAFAKSKADERKEWLRGYNPAVYVDHSLATISYSDFVDKELIHYSNADNVRSIPSVVDGLKPGQRKIMFACFKRGKSLIKNEIKVAQLAGYVSEHSAYHHGEQSLASTIIGMAQTYVGSNNLPLLHPAGQFGTRLQGGKDSASPRYIFTKLPALTRMLFHPDDDALLDYLQDDGMSIEPMFYVPILPLVLINGSDGIGTGWSSSVPQHNPRDVIANLKRMMAGEEPHLMSPWYRGFNGVIVPDNRGSFITYGTVAKDASDERVLHISELPVRTWTQEYKDKVLEPMLTGVAAADKDKDAKGAKVEQLLDDVREYHTDTKVSFTLRYLTAAPLQEAEAKGQLHKQLKLSSTISMTNLTLFDEQGRIHRHESVASILASFYELRLSYYEKRKLHLAEKLTAEFDKLDNRTRFISAVISGELKISNVKKEVLVATLDKMGYKRFEPVLKKKRAGGDDEDEDEEDTTVNVDEKTGAAAAAKASAARGYDYLLSMPLWSLTAEKVEQLRNELRAKETELQALLATTPKQLWTTDLDAFLEAYSTWEAQIAAEEAGGPAPKKGGKAKAPAPKAASKAKLSEDEEDDDFMEDDNDDDWDAKPKKKKAAPPKGASRAPTPPPPPPSAASSVVVPVPAAPPPPKRKAPTAAKAGKEEEGSDEDAELDGEDAPVVAPAAAPKRKAPAASKAKKEEAEAAWRPPSSLGDGGDVSDAMDEAGPSPAARPVVKRACSKPSPALALGRAKRATAVTSFAGMDEEEDDDEMGSDDSDEDAEFNEEEDSDDDFVEEKPKAKAKAAPKPTAPKAPAPPPAAKAAPKSKYVEVLDDDEEDDEEDYVPAKKAPSKAAPKPVAPKPAPKPKAPPPKESEAVWKPPSSLGDEDDEDEYVPAKKAAPKHVPKSKYVDVSDDEEGDEEDYVAAKKAPPKAAPKPVAPKPAPKPKAPPKPKAKKAASDDDDDDYEDVEEVAPRAASSRPGRAAAAKASQKAKAVLAEDDDDDSEYVGSD